mmetsp:Transcript_29783/g.68588  ORF Transcript_29783/g.68588 Transcript_29783/m.68588 type:complete len:213 (+) Transcript_29783:2397-3035(+)
MGQVVPGRVGNSSLQLSTTSMEARDEVHPHLTEPETIQGHSQLWKWASATKVPCKRERQHDHVMQYGQEAQDVDTQAHIHVRVQGIAPLSHCGSAEVLASPCHAILTILHTPSGCEVHDCTVMSSTVQRLPKLNTSWPLIRHTVGQSIAVHSDARFATSRHLSRASLWRFQSPVAHILGFRGGAITVQGMPRGSWKPFSRKHSIIPSCGAAH